MDLVATLSSKGERGRYVTGDKTSFQESMYHGWLLNLFNAESTIVQSTRMQFL